MRDKKARTPQHPQPTTELGLPVPLLDLLPLLAYSSFWHSNLARDNDAVHLAHRPEINSSSSHNHHTEDVIMIVIRNFPQYHSRK